MSTGLSAFAQGMAGPLANLPAMLQAKKQMELQREQLEMQRQNQGLAAEQFEREMALREQEASSLAEYRGAQTDLGRDTLDVRRTEGEGLNTFRQGQLALQEDEFGLKQNAYERGVAAENRQLDEMARGQLTSQFLSTWDGSDEGFHGNLQNFNRRVQQNPEYFSALHSLGEGRTPVGYRMVQTPQGPRIALDVNNMNTGSTGPQTEGASASPDDNVVFTDPGSLRRMMSAYGGVPDPVAMAAANREPDKFSFGETRDGRTTIRNETTGEVTYKPTPDAIAQSLRDVYNSWQNPNMLAGPETERNSRLAWAISGKYSEMPDADPRKAEAIINNVRDILEFEDDELVQGYKDGDTSPSMRDAYATQILQRAMRRVDPASMSQALNSANNPQQNEGLAAVNPGTPLEDDEVDPRSIMPRRPNLPRRQWSFTDNMTL